MNPAAKAWALAAAAGALALGSALTAAGVVRRAALRQSHQRPIDDTWFEHQEPVAPALVARGCTLFLDSCAHCHGADARGDEGPDLHGVQVSDRYMARIIAHGIPHEMPSFAKKHDAADIHALIAYVHSLEAGKVE